MFRFPYVSKFLIVKQYADRTRHDRLGKVIHWESTKRFKFDYQDKWYMQKSESIQENETKSESIQENEMHEIL